MPAEELSELNNTESDLDALSALRITTVESKNDSDSSGVTEWLGFTYTQKRIFALAGFPKPTNNVVGPPVYEVRETPDMGLGVFATRDMKAGELIVAERPLVVVPADITDFAIGFEEDGETEKAQAILHVWEEAYQMLVDRLSPENRDAFLGFTNSHTEDGSGRITGIIQTNGYAVYELAEDPSGPLDNVSCGYSAVGMVGSRFNHR